LSLGLGGEGSSPSIAVIFAWSSRLNVLREICHLLFSCGRYRSKPEGGDTHLPVDSSKVGCTTSFSILQTVLAGGERFLTY
jgi:hypothetical protein